MTSRMLTQIELLWQTKKQTVSPRAIAKCLTLTSTFVTIQSGSTGYLFEQERAPPSRQDFTSCTCAYAGLAVSS